MKIAVTYENGQVFQHFGHTEQFKLYEVEDGRVVSSQVVDTNGSGHGALAGFLREYGVAASAAEPGTPWPRPASSSTPAPPAAPTPRWRPCWPAG